MGFFLVGVWVIESLLKLPGLFSVFWPILKMLLFGRSPQVLLFPSPPVPLSILSWLYRSHQLQLVSPSCSCFIVYFQFSTKFEVLIILFTFFHFYPVVSWNGKVHYSASSLFLLTVSKSGRLAEIRWSVCISISPRSSCVSFSGKEYGLCLYYLFIWSNLRFLYNS